MGLLTQTEMVERARQICASVTIPIIVDADTGYGNPLNVYRTIEQLIAAEPAKTPRNPAVLPDFDLFVKRRAAPLQPHAHQEAS